MKSKWFMMFLIVACNNEAVDIDGDANASCAGEVCVDTGVVPDDLPPPPQIETNQDTSRNDENSSVDQGVNSDVGAVGGGDLVWSLTSILPPLDPQCTEFHNWNREAYEIYLESLTENANVTVNEELCAESLEGEEKTLGCRVDSVDDIFSIIWYYGGNKSELIEICDSVPQSTSIDP